MPPSIPLPLSPYRVLDLTNERGWLCARMLGDMGADVIKVEPPGGDTGRRFGPFYRGEAHREKSIPFWAWNANKRSVTLDLTTADGQALFRQLVSLSDFVVESLGRGHLDNLGLGYEALAALNPSVILTSITPYGPEGPKRDWASVDLTLQAAGGLMHLAGNEDRAPLQVSMPQAYAQAGAQAALASMVAHHHRRITGRGQRADVSAQAAITNDLIDVQQHWSVGHKIVERGLITSWGPIKHRVLFKCKDGYVTWKWFVDKGRGRRNVGLLQWMREEGADEGVADWDFEAMTLYSIKQEQVDKLERVAAAFLEKKTKAEIYEQSLKRRFLSFPVNTPKDIFEDKQIAYRQFFQPVQHAELGETIKYPGSWAKTLASPALRAPSPSEMERVRVQAESPYGVRLRPPLIGEHNDDVLKGLLGLTTDEMVTLKEAGVI